MVGSSPLRFPVKVWVLFITCLALFACGAEDQSGGQTPTDPNTVCSAPAGLAITDVNTLTDWINALPKPTSLPCFLESLPRPLYLTASESDFSAQPSFGKRSPRVFIFIDKLVLTIVMTHDTRLDKEGKPIVDLLELGFLTSDLSMLQPGDPVMTIKGEYKFPVTETLPYSAPYDHIDFDDNLSNCAFCHREERLVDAVAGVPVYESVMIQPQLGDLVDISRLLAEQLYCDPVAEPFRCAMYDALISHGPVYHQAFPQQADFFQ